MGLTPPSLNHSPLIYGTL
uniref:Uncharacterized protein n=1 Tax=Anguilla anguilla TaxID=7936 RepID=A0A0E9R433_ANGAN